MPVMDFQVEPVHGGRLRRSPICGSVGRPEDVHRLADTRSSCSTIESRPPSARVSSSSAAAGSAGVPAGGRRCRGRVGTRRGPARRHPAGRASLWPNLPVTYSSVRGSLGVEKIACVGPTSTISPLSMKAVRVGHTRGLLHVVGHDHDRAALFERRDQLLDLQGCDRVECRAGLVHQQHLGVHRQ